MTARAPRQVSKTGPKRPSRPKAGPPIPPWTDWRTSDEDEIARRRLRAREEPHRIRNLAPGEPIFSTMHTHLPYSAKTACKGCERV